MRSNEERVRVIDLTETAIYYFPPEKTKKSDAPVAAPKPDYNTCGATGNLQNLCGYPEVHRKPEL